MRWPRKHLPFFQDRVTRLFAWVYQTPIEGVESFTTWSGEYEVYWFDNPNSSTFGQATPAGTIVLNKGRLSQASEHARRYVVEHERGHQTRRLVFKLLLFGLAALMALGGVGLLQSIGLGLLIPLGFPTQQVLALGIVSVLMTGLGVIAFRLEEAAADLHVLKFISEADYVDVHEELSGIRDTRLKAVVRRKLLYPSPERVVQIHQVLQQIGTQKLSS